MVAKAPVHPLPSAEDIALARKGEAVLSDILKKEKISYSIGISDIEGNSYQIELPALAIKLLKNTLEEISNGNSISIMAHQSELSTQEAADALNVSRPFLVKLLEQGDIPFHKVGTHRRIKHKDIIDYMEYSDAE